MNRRINTSQARKVHHFSLGYFAVLLLAVTALGCGAQAYETRLAETDKYFKYREKIDSALEKRPFEDFGITIRVPLGFKEIPRPDAEENFDPRQPNFFRAHLPGLLAAWQKNSVEVDEGDENITDRPAWIFLCTNHQRWLDKTKDAKVEPLAFHQDIAAMLANDLSGYSADDIGSWEYHDERVPRQNEKAYVPRKDYSWITLEDTMRLPENQRAEMEVMLTTYFEGEIQMALICVAPKFLARRDQFYGPIKLCMETLKMSGEAPRPRTEGPKTGGGF
jgi:hypothetical protein